LTSIAILCLTLSKRFNLIKIRTIGSSKLFLQSLLILFVLTFFAHFTVIQQFAQVSLTTKPTLKTITIPNCVQPPDDAIVDHATLSNSDIQKYGYPPRPPFTDKATQAQWVSFVKGANHRSCTLTETGITASSQPSIYNSKWAGWSQKMPNFPNNAWQYVFANWHAPAIAWDSVWPSASVDWVGLGGVNNQFLVQVGTLQNIDTFNNHIYGTFVENTGNIFGVPGYDSWHGTGAYWLYGIGSGDSISAVVVGNYMGIKDNTTNMYGSAQYGPGPAQNTFECMHERPLTDPWLYGSTQAPLTKTATVQFYNCEGQDDYGNWYQVGDNSFDYTPFGITSNGQPSGTLIANPSVTWYYGQFYVWWQASE